MEMDAGRNLSLSGPVILPDYQSRTDMLQVQHLASSWTPFLIGVCTPSGEVVVYTCMKSDARRLYRSVVEDKLACKAWSSHQPTKVWRSNARHDEPPLQWLLVEGGVVVLEGPYALVHLATFLFSCKYFQSSAPCTLFDLSIPIQTTPPKWQLPSAP